MADRIRISCKHLYEIQVRKHKPVLVCLHCGKAVP
jgi:hypothetical protein